MGKRKFFRLYVIRFLAVFFLLIFQLTVDGCGGGGDDNGGGGSAVIDGGNDDIDDGSGGDDMLVPGDDCDTAMSIDVNTSYSGMLETDVDYHYFKISIATGGTLTVYTTGNTDTLGAILDKDCGLLEEDDDSGDVLNFKIIRPVDAGAYYLALTPAMFGETGPYTLNIEFSGSSDSGTGGDFNGIVSLPVTSPVTMDEVEVEILTDTEEPDSSGHFTGNVSSDTPLDATVMLPQREGDSLPTVYLFTTRLPGEIEIDISTEETAIGLLMNGISHDYLIQAGTPETVKQIIRQNGQAFIQKFIQMIEQDPYVLRVENLDNVYDQTYLEAVKECKTALKNMISTGTLSAKAHSGQNLSGIKDATAFGQLDQWRSVSDKGMNQGRYSLMATSEGFIVKPTDTIDDFVIHPDTGTAGSVIGGGKMTGSIRIENDSMLFAHYKVTELNSGQVIKNVPTEFSYRAFHPDIIGPQGGWGTGYWASTSVYEAKFQSVTIEIYTPGMLGNTWSEYIDGPSGALACRTMYSSVFIPVVKLVIPASEGTAKEVFDYMADIGLFDIPFDKWEYGDYKGGVWDFIKKIADKETFVKLVKAFFRGLVIDDNKISKYVSKLLVKFVPGANTIEVAGTAVDIAKLATDVLSTNMKIEFQVIFPVTLNTLTPTTLTKVSDEEDNPVFKLEGTGLDAFMFEGDTYSPTIILKSKDQADKDIQHTINSDDITENADGTALEFKLPYLWSQVGSKVSAPIYVSLEHAFVDYAGVNEIVLVNLPARAAKEKFKIDLVTDLAIESLSKDKVSENDELYIYGKGFAGFYLDNKVVFMDRDDKSIEAVIDAGDGTFLKVIVPKGLATGKIWVHVELKDKTRSNEKPLDMLPKMVTAEPGDNTNFEDTLDVWLWQDQLYDIYYSIDNGAVQMAVGPITLNQTSHIYPYARATIDGLNYDSPTGDFFYYKCAEGEVLENGECITSDDDDGNGDEGDIWDKWPNPQWCPQTGDGGSQHTIQHGYFATQCDYYYNGQLSMETSYKDGESYGYHKYYYESGRLQREYFYQNGMITGVHKEYYESGQLEREIPYQNGKENGVAKLYYEDGQLEMEAELKDDMRHGIVKWYYQNGQLYNEISYQNDVQHGMEKYYSESGVLLTCKIYENGIMVGDCSP